MELIDYTNKWVTGEILEDLAMIAGGVICLLLALVAWRWGTSESARAIILPLTVVAVILVALGGSLAYSNHTRQKQFVEQYQKSPEKFLESEKARVADFMKIYPQTIIASTVNKQVMQQTPLAMQKYLTEYLTAATEIQQKSIAEEPGVLCLFPNQMKENNNSFRILEIYASQEAYQHHIQTAHFQKYKHGTLHMVKSLKLQDLTPLDRETMSKIFKKLSFSMRQK